MEDEVFGRIYGIEYLILNKIYIGQTTKPVEERIKEHRYCTTSYIGREIHKHGWENFTWVVLEECYSREELNAAEMKWIKFLNTKCPNGYNLTDGGDSNARKGRKLTEDHKRKIGDGNRGKKRSDLTKLLLSVIQKGQPSRHTLQGDCNISITKRKVVFPNLDAKLIKQNLTYREIGRRLNLKKTNLLGKLNGTRKLDLKTAQAIKDLLKVDMPLEKLFARINENGELEGTKKFAVSKRKDIYHNLNEELKRQNINYSELARRLNVCRNTISKKLNGKIPLDENTARAIYELLKVDMPIEKLFATTDGECKFEELPESLTRKDKKVFYPNLNVELNRQKISYKNLAESLGVRKVTISNKLSGKIKLDEKTARAIYELLKVDMPIEKLFMTFDGECGIKKN